MPKIVPKERACIFFSQVPMPSLTPHKSIMRVTGNADDAKKVEKALILDQLLFFNPVQKEYDYFYFYTPLKQGQKINFLQLKDTYKLRFKNTLPAEKAEQSVSMTYALLKLLRLGYKEVLLVNPMAVLLEYRNVRNAYDLLRDFDTAIWRQQDGTVGVYAMRNSDTLVSLLEPLLPCTASKLFYELKAHPGVTFKEISPPLSPIESLFNHSPLQIKQYFPELERFGRIVG